MDFFVRLKISDRDVECFLQTRHEMGVSVCPRVPVHVPICFPPCPFPCPCPCPENKLKIMNTLQNTCSIFRKCYGFD
jgi:hypothetical protein